VSLVYMTRHDTSPYHNTTRIPIRNRRRRVYILLLVWYMCVFLRAVPGQDHVVDASSGPIETNSKIIENTKHGA